MILNLHIFSSTPYLRRVINNQLKHRTKLCYSVVKDFIARGSFEPRRLTLLSSELPVNPWTGAGLLFRATCFSVQLGFSASCLAAVLEAVDLFPQRRGVD
jgi:hypothetical protein